jgi:hypothetical protein
MKRGGQVSAFILIGVVILVVLGLLYYLSTLFNKDKQEPKEVTSVQGFVKQCVTSASEQALYTVGRQGGYIVLPSNILKQSYSSMGYGFFNDKNMLPGLNNIQKELEDYVSSEIPQCLEGLTSLGYPVKTGTDIHTAITFADSDVVVSTTVPMSITVGGSVQTFDEFIVRVPVRFRHIYDIASGICDNLVNFPGYINLTYLGNQDIDVNVLTYNNSQVFVLEDQKSLVAGEHYRFMFGAENHG